ncbi:MAG: superoxide dismutase family protein [Myxococcota bacterium]
MHSLQALAIVLLAAGACDGRDPGTRRMDPTPIVPADPSHASPGRSNGEVSRPVDPGTTAKADLTPTIGNEARGIITFSSTPEGVRVAIAMTGLTPGSHGFHLHEWGDCSAPDASSAGSHFDPSAMPHGAPDDDLHHAGDFGNLEADDAGHVEVAFVTDAISLDSDHSILVARRSSMQVGTIWRPSLRATPDRRSLAA